MNPQRQHTPLITSFAIAMAAALALSACDRNDDRTAGQKLDAAVAKTEQAATEAKADIQRETADAKATAQQQAAEAKADVSAAAERAKEAVAAAGSKTSAALEKTGDKISAAASDAGITAGVNSELAKDQALSALSINVDTSNGRVSLSGTAPSAAARDRATLLAKSVKGVTTVDNKLVVRS